jgi:bifunctional DNA-binding transcriptional regulator/antitoxin component of YhaV-PrlF toxin-antitoxin module
MGDNTHTLTAQGVSNQDTMQVTVPADVQREHDIAIDDEVEVAIHGVSSLIDRASFEGRQTAGDRVTIPAQVARQLSLVAGEDYEFGFDTVEDDVPAAIPDEDVTDDEEVEEAIEEAEEEMEDDSPGLGELFSTEDEEETEDEQEEEGLGELFG